MGNFINNKEVIKRNSKEIAYSQVQESPNIVIKQSKIANVEIIKLSMQIDEVELIYDSVDKIQVDIRYSSQVNFLLSVYTFIEESKQHRFERTMLESTIQKFKCPKGLNHQIPSKYIEFMIIDLIKFSRIRATPEKQYHNLILEMKSLTSKSSQIIYFYKIDCNQQTFRCELINTKQLIVYKNCIYEIHELYGIKNTPFNPQWNPNTVEDKECVICFCNMINTILLPCKHMCTCSNCADYILLKQKVKQCPLCRIDIDNYLTLEIKDKEKQDLQLRQFQEEQQKYLEVNKEKKEQQAIKQSQIMEQLQSKIHQDQIKKLNFINDIKDFQRNNSNEENQSDQIEKIKKFREQDNNNESMQLSQDDQQKYQSKQRISNYDFLKQERRILNSFQQEKQNNSQQESNESEISQNHPYIQSLKNFESYQISKQQYQCIFGTNKAYPTVPNYFKESQNIYQLMAYIDNYDMNDQSNLYIQQIQNQQKDLEEQFQMQSQEFKFYQQQQHSQQQLVKYKNQQIQFCQLQQYNIKQGDEIIKQFELNVMIQQFNIENDYKRIQEAQNKQVLEEFTKGLFATRNQFDDVVLKNKIEIEEAQKQCQDDNDCRLRTNKGIYQQFRTIFTESSLGKE
ncbi:unnamed protein product [Paramecium sonneborni]|uniref:RING-type domain-containing protein n=1 Tax=Paramecium sonneborni TaxID=65129 RepID=A0A8S1LKQ2_9CILI|nr:unnamed protein product [Paramecium sonneborni]